MEAGLHHVGECRPVAAAATEGHRNEPIWALHPRPRYAHATISSDELAQRKVITTS